MSANGTNRPILEMRVALTTGDYERMTRFYCEGLGLNPAELWTTEQSQAALFEMGNATLEIFDEAHAASVDDIEAGKRTSGQIRFALQVARLTGGHGQAAREWSDPRAPSHRYAVGPP